MGFQARGSSRRKRSTTGCCSFSCTTLSALLLPGNDWRRENVRDTKQLKDNVRRREAPPPVAPPRSSSPSERWRPPSRRRLHHPGGSKAALPPAAALQRLGNADVSDCPVWELGGFPALGLARSAAEEPSLLTQTLRTRSWLLLKPQIIYSGGRITGRIWIFLHL